MSALSAMLMIIQNVQKSPYPLLKLPGRLQKTPRTSWLSSKEKYRHYSTQ